MCCILQCVKLHGVGAEEEGTPLDLVHTARCWVHEEEAQIPVLPVEALVEGVAWVPWVCNLVAAVRPLFVCLEAGQDCLADEKGNPEAWVMEGTACCCGRLRPQAKLLVASVILICALRSHLALQLGKCSLCVI